MDFFIYSAILNAFISGLLGFTIFIRNRKDIVNKIFFAIIISIIVWSIGYWQWMSLVNSGSYNSALFWVRILSIGSLFIPLFYFHWIMAFVGLNKEKKNLIRFFYIIIFIFLLFSFSKLFIAKLEPKLFFNFWPTPGIIYTIYLFFIYFGLVGYSLFILWKQQKIILEPKKSSIKYIIMGSIVAFGGGATNFFLWYNIPILPYGNILVSIYPIVFTIAIIKYQLFNIRVIATELLTFSTWIFVLIRMLFSETPKEWFINGSLLAFVVVSGILLIRSVLKEVRTREEMEKLAGELGVANEKLKRLDQAKTEFISIASHQLRSPLTAIKGYSSMILEGSYGAISDKIKETIDKIFVSSNRLVSIIGDFLDVSRIELGKMQYEFTDFDIREMIQNLVEEFKANYKDQKLELSFESKDAGKVMVNADFNKIRQVISNIIDNAMKYTDKGFVKVFLSQNPANPPAGEERDKILIAIKDSGRGMDKDDLGKIFQKFSRANGAAKSRIQGSGLGLYVASEMVKAHKGRVWAESEGIGKGSTFFVELPKKV